MVRWRRLRRWGRRALAVSAILAAMLGLGFYAPGILAFVVLLAFIWLVLTRAAVPYS